MVATRPQPIKSTVSVGKTRDRVAKIADVGSKTVQRAKNVIDRGSQKLNDAIVESGGDRKSDEYKKSVTAPVPYPVTSKQSEREMRENQTNFI